MGGLGLVALPRTGGLPSRETPAGAKPVKLPPQRPTGARFFAAGEQVIAVGPRGEKPVYRQTVSPER